MMKGLNPTQFLAAALLLSLVQTGITYSVIQKGLEDNLWGLFLMPISIGIIYILVGLFSDG
jgi:hypothetical protein